MPLDKEKERHLKRVWGARHALRLRHKSNFQSGSYRPKRPELWIETNAQYEGVYYELLRIFYPDGSSEYLTLNTYHDNGDILVNVSAQWSMSYGNDWFAVDYFVSDKRTGTKAQLLEVL